MKKYIFTLLLITAAVLSCNTEAKNSTSNNTDEVAQVETKHATIMLDKQKFLNEIMNYEENKTEWIYKGNLPGIVDFYADWCRPCRITSPILEELAVEYAGKINVYKVDIQKERELASVFGVQSIPTFLFMPMEGKPSISSGIAQTPEQTKEMFVQQIEEVLLKNEKVQ